MSATDLKSATALRVEAKDVCALLILLGSLLGSYFAQESVTSNAIEKVRGDAVASEVRLRGEMSTADAEHETRIRIVEEGMRQGRAERLAAQSEMLARIERIGADMTQKIDRLSEAVLRGGRDAR